IWKGGFPASPAVSVGTHGPCVHPMEGRLPSLPPESNLVASALRARPRASNYVESALRARPRASNYVDSALRARLRASTLVTIPENPEP
ncbi:MAG: hypothetical protein K2K75_01710, partial [Muribaculaceae bacterium]|nr:hypothetical protein [Muribaculaceae bacterium]